MTAVDTTATAAWLARYHDVVAPVLPSYFDVIADRAEGSWVWDVEGRRYLDLGSGIAVTNTGHRHPRRGRGDRTSRSTACSTPRSCSSTSRTSRRPRPSPGSLRSSTTRRCSCATAAPRRSTAPSSWPGAPPASPGSSPSSRLPRPHDGRHHAHHRQGRRTRRATRRCSLACTSRRTASRAYEPPHGDRRRRRGCRWRSSIGCSPARRRRRRWRRWSSSRCSARAATSCRPSRGWRGLRERCDEHGILLVFDEVQCGFGRTGRPFAAETFGVRPDVVLFAKGVASGLPLAGIMAGAALMDRWPQRHPRLHLRRQPGVVRGRRRHHRRAPRARACYDRAVQLGERVQAPSARTGRSRRRRIVEVRGIGAMIGVELRDKATAEAVQQRCLADGRDRPHVRPGGQRPPPHPAADDDRRRARPRPRRPQPAP